ncbi:MAG: hypothetical protein CL930_07890 [Deltaproteobacteria bacterium]|nr:hypothetical protein [Deltaproteobacteria bacterium]
MSNDDANQDPTQNNDPDGVQPIVTEVLPITDQIGRHVMSALHSPGSVAVLTTIVTGINSDRIVSVGLTPEQMAGVQAVIESIAAEDEEAAADEERCIGFQCRVPGTKDA